MADSRPRRLLALDGGGVKGLTSLFILRRIMHKIMTDQKLDELPLPCDYFDLICGTSTGGLIAIMLGRLRMGVNECIDAYQKLAGDVFGQKRIGGLLFNASVGLPLLYTNNLEQAIKDIIKQKCSDPNIPLLNQEEQKCKVFVCAIRTESSYCELLRTYPSSKEEGHDCMLWEAARATSAAPGFFERIQFQRSKASFADGALGRNNPIRVLINEARQIWPDLPLGCVISIGTGLGKIGALGNKLHALLKKCVEIATDAENEADSFLEDDQGIRLWDEKRYFRFNVQRGLEDVKLDEASPDDLEKLRAMTTAYLNNTKTAAEVDICAQYLVHPLSSLTSRGESTTNTNRFEIIPFKRDPQFIGRHQILDEMDKYFKSLGHSRLALVGLGGVGKTQIALEYAHRLRAANPQTSIFWIHASNIDRIEQAYRKIADTAKFSGRDKSKVSIMALVGEWLQSEQSGKWLLVIDNIDNQSLIFDKDKKTTTLFFKSLPWKEDGTVLFTTRDRAVGVKATAGNKLIQVQVMSHQEGQQLLQKKYPEADFASEDCNKLLLTMEYLPLAISQAAAYLQETCLPISDYLRLYNESENNKMELLSGEFVSMARYDDIPNPVIATWIISFELLQKEHPIAADLLALISHFDRQGIPRILLEPDSEDSLLFEGNMGRLKALAFVRTNEENKTYEIHRLVQLATRAWLSVHGRLAQWEQEAVARLHDQLTHVKHRNDMTRELDMTLCPHAQVVIGYKVDNRDSLLQQASILHCLALYCGHISEYYEGLENVNKALEIYSRFLEKGSPVFIHAKRLRGTLLADTNDISAAETILIDVLKNSKKVDTPFLDAKSSLAAIYTRLGRLEDAERLQLEIIETQEQRPAQDPCNILSYKLRLAMNYTMQEKWKEQEEFIKGILDTDERIQRMFTEERSRFMHLLAVNYYYRRCFKEAEEILLQALEIRKQSSLEKDPTTLMMTSTLASIYDDLRRFKEAEKLRNYVLETFTRLFGTDHRYTAMSQHNLGSTYACQHRLKEGEELSRQAMNTMQRIRGPDDSETLTIKTGLGERLLYQGQGREREAEKLLVQVLDSRMRVLGPEHPETLSSMQNVSYCHMACNRFEKALELLLHVMESREKNGGKEDTEMLRSLVALENSTAELGKPPEAAAMFEKALCIGQNIYDEGEANPDMMVLRRRYAELRSAM